MKARLELERYQNPGLKWGLVVSALAIFYENMSSNLAKIDSFLQNLKMTKINEKRPWLAHLKNLD